MKHRFLLLQLIITICYMNAETTKIVGLVIGSNQEQFLPHCLENLSRITDSIIYLDNGSLDHSAVIVRDLSASYNVEAIIKQQYNTDTVFMYNSLLECGRSIGGTHFIVIHADELFTMPCIYDNILRKMITNLKPGESLALPHIYLNNKLNTYFYTHDQLYQLLIFADDRIVFYDDQINRIPTMLQGMQWYWENEFHFCLMNLGAVTDSYKNMYLVLQQFLQVIEGQTLDRNISLKNEPYKEQQTPYIWFNGNESNINGYQLAQITVFHALLLELIAIYGIDYFLDADLAMLDWNGIFIIEEGMQSQYEQDAFMDTCVFNKKRNGIFVDIGAHDGLKWSNSYFFEKIRNWKGICIEPITEAFNVLKQNRTATCINACVGKYDGIANFYHISGEPEQLSGLVDTYHVNHKERMEREVKKDNSQYTIEQKDILALNTILEQQGIYYVDYLSLDTEGSELDILQAIDFDRFYIKAMSVENMYYGESLRTFLATKGFKFVARLHECDDIYINTKKS